MTRAELQALWDERDNRYRDRRPGRASAQMAPESARAVRAYRRAEVALLSPEARRVATLELNRWYPPSAR